MEEREERKVTCPACGGSYDREYGVCPQCGAVCPAPEPEDTGGLFPPFVPRWRKALVCLAAAAALVSGWMLWQGGNARPAPESAAPAAAASGDSAPWAGSPAPPADTISPDIPG